uniref:Uncharacterized protein n=1 Tax=Ananas comosus var. bracteatus TaxID=296719 RepID=A0A6V7NWV7_ANACO|nr:unnamed protein product [Ananas comosus var. bracteatus]
MAPLPQALNPSPTGRSALTPSVGRGRSWPTHNFYCSCPNTKCDRSPLLWQVRAHLHLPEQSMLSLNKRMVSKVPILNGILQEHIKVPNTVEFADWIGRTKQKKIRVIWI